MTCQVCSNSIEEERLEALPTTMFCIKCAHKHNTKPRRGVMVYDNDLCGELITMAPHDFENYRGYLNPMSDINFVRAE